MPGEQERRSGLLLPRACGTLGGDHSLRQPLPELSAGRVTRLQPVARRPTARRRGLLRRRRLQAGQAMAHPARPPRRGHGSATRHGRARPNRWALGPRRRRVAPLDHQLRNVAGAGDQRGLRRAPGMSRRQTMGPEWDHELACDGLQGDASLSRALAPKREDPRGCRDLHARTASRLERRTGLEPATLSLGS
jgi:hypothetical protein